MYTLCTEIELLNGDLALRKELTSELETYVENLMTQITAVEEEAQVAAHKLNVALEENKSLVNQVIIRTTK